MDKIAEALGPWPILQLFFGMSVLGIGIFALIRGMYATKPDDDRHSLEEARQEWEAYQQLADIARHTEAIAQNQKVMLDRINQCTESIKQLAVSINALSAALWNQRQ